MRHTRFVLMVLAAMFVVAVPTAVAQTPVADQYDVVAPGGDSDPPDLSGSSPGDDSGSDPDDIAGVSPGDDSGSAPAGGGSTAPVSVGKSSTAAPGSLPFTGTQVSPIALIGLGLLALGVVGAAVARRRGGSVASQRA